MGEYRPYPDYKDSGVEWLGKIPDSWGHIPLKYLCTFLGGGTPSKDNLDYWGGDIPWVSPKDMKGSRITGAIDQITPQGIADSSTSLIPAGAVLLVVRSGILQHTIPVAINDVPVTLNQDMKALRFRSHTEARFFYYYVTGLQKQLLLEWSKQGATVESLEQEHMGNAVIPWPPSREQENIAAFLDYETARIDRLIAKQERLIELLKEKRQAVISHAVTKGLNPDAPMKDSGVEWLGEVPAHWVVAGFKKFLESIVDYRGKTPNKVDEGVLLVTARNIGDGKIDYTASQEFISPNEYEEVMRRGTPRIGDVLFVTEAPLGEVACVDREDIALAQRVIKFRGKAGLLDNYFLKYFIMSTPFQSSLIKYATGSTALGIKAERLVYLRQLVPPIEEQRAIVEYLDMELSKFDLLTQKARAAIELMQEHRTALISAAVTGKIDVRNFEPTNA